MSTGDEYVSGTHGSGILSSATDVLGMSVVREIKGDGGVCEMCMCLNLTWNCVGGERVSG